MKLVIIILLSNIFCQTVLYFNGNNAMEYLKEQCHIGPRYPGSPGHREAIELYKKHFNKYFGNVTLFEDYTIHPHSGDSIKLTNIFSRFNPESELRILLMAHYDTREYADQDPDQNNYNTPIIGANDGASGVAVLMEMAKFLSENSFPNIGVDMLLTDGEDMGNSGDIDSWALGAKLVANKLPPPKAFEAICVDMVGDKELSLPIEQNSYRQAPQLVFNIWNLANELGFKQFKMEMGRSIVDDHYAFYNQTGIPSIDIIDFDYPNSEKNYWHTLEDTPDKCSSESLEAVGTVLINYLYRLDMELNGQ
tara:strand:+ start:1900 stop:2820 length:921 start_codon:yes stop_codon:yes gene_type:complete